MLRFDMQACHDDDNDDDEQNKTKQTHDDTAVKRFTLGLGTMQAYAFWTFYKHTLNFEHLTLSLEVTSPMCDLRKSAKPAACHQG